MNVLHARRISFNLLLLVFIPMHSEGSPTERLKEASKLAFSIATFQPSLWLRSLNFDRIAADVCSEDALSLRNGMRVSFDEQGNITAMHDGRRTSLLLGNIPRSKQDIKAIQKACAVPKGYGVAVLSLNKKFERDWAGLTDIFSGKRIKSRLFLYPTIDRTAPSFIDLLRVVRDIKLRDERAQGATYVHCRAGRGRSATAVTAYLICILHEGGVTVSVEMVEQYVKQCRSQVSMNGEQKRCLAQFKSALEQAGSFEQLCAAHQEEIVERDQEVTLL